MNRYILADGTETCGVTTVLDEWKETLFGWKSEAVEHACVVGQQLHALIDRANAAALSGMECPGAVDLHPETMAEVATGMASFVAWCAARNPKIVASEKQVISERWRIGGTIDCKAWVDGKLRNIDWKPMRAGTAARLQLTAYAEMDHEVDPLNATDDCMIVSLNRDPKIGPKFDDRRRWEKNPADVRIFQNLVELRAAREGLRARHKAALSAY